ncbi:MAG: hypothetical protein QOH43_335, partial [Solirubrobacteraceae bacterium]|nr:hypothetical protein [Solirubrobacteraceae bacterium]
HVEHLRIAAHGEPRAASDAPVVT